MTLEMQIDRKGVTVTAKEPWLAVNLSMLFPGLGQIYAGKKFRGLFLLVIQVILIGIAIWSIFSSS